MSLNRASKGINSFEGRATEMFKSSKAHYTYHSISSALLFRKGVDQYDIGKK